LRLLIGEPTRRKALGGVQIGAQVGYATREKQIKAWKRDWKLELIEKSNPEWRDLYEELVS